ncbi:hypothetical protein NC652_023181 [Populus alba x Populus x berolinensis]|nr:hypothetical protein NC652_023181 [Populus alba x Populus x berolinensis]
MNGNRQMEVHYINTGFPYTTTESFMDFFEGLTHAPVNYAHTGPMHDQDSAYWPMNMNAYKFGFSGPGSTSYYSPYEVNDNLPIMDVSRTAWEYPSVVNAEEPTTTDTQFEGDEDMGVHAIHEERSISNQPSANSPQAVLQDDVDPDNMTYEELLDLGDTVGTQSKGLSPELIRLLPTSKCKFGSFFSRKKSGERCVICQMKYKRGDKQIKLLCKHVYHSECIAKWLGINKRYHLEHDLLAWASRPLEDWKTIQDCNHPKTADDFFKTTPTSKLSSSGDKARSRTPLDDKNLRDAKLKRRGQSQSSFTSSDYKAKFNEDSENRNPNLSTPSNYQKSMKQMIKSSSEKNRPIDDVPQTREESRLKSTLSARNLFAGKDILGHITEFCNELKKLATRAREKESLNEKGSQVGEKKDGVVVNEGSREVLGELNVKEKERKPLLNNDREKPEGNEKGSAKQGRKKRVDDTENIPVPLNLANVKNKGEERLLQIRTNPPSPQCFSANRAPAKTTPSKASRSRLTERGILQELKKDKETTEDRSPFISDGKESKALDVFWFLKPCTTLSS